MPLYLYISLAASADIDPNNSASRAVLVTYMAVRDRAGKYLGTVELVQDMEFAREHFAGQRSGKPGGGTPRR